MKQPGAFTKDRHDGGAQCSPVGLSDFFFQKFDCVQQTN